MSKVAMGWRNKNSTTAYPLKNNSDLPHSLIVDACVFLEPPVALTKIDITPDYYRFFINDGIYWRYPLAGDPPDFLYNDYGKIVLDDLSFFDNKPSGWSADISVEFVETVCYPPVFINLMGLGGDISLAKVELDIDGEDITLYLPESTSFNYGGISHINNELVVNGNLQLIGDACTQITMRDGLVVIDDICLPPCFDCNDRLTTGDVHLLMTELEDRVTDLEP